MKLHAGVGEYGTAELWLREALRRNPRLGATVNLYLALIARARGDDKAA